MARSGTPRCLEKRDGFVELLHWGPFYQRSTEAVALTLTILTNAELTLNERTQYKYWIYIILNRKKVR